MSFDEVSFRAKLVGFFPQVGQGAASTTNPQADLITQIAKDALVSSQNPRHTVMEFITTTDELRPTRGQPKELLCLIEEMVPVVQGNCKKRSHSSSDSISSPAPQPVEKKQKEEDKKLSTSSTKNQEAGQKEKLFLDERKGTMVGKLFEWQEGYKPEIGGILSMMSGMLEPYVKARSTALCESVIFLIGNARNRNEFIAVLEHYKESLNRSQKFMDSSSKSKIQELFTMIDKEITILSQPGFVKDESSQSFKDKFFADDPLLKNKVDAWDTIAAWKTTFSPQIPSLAKLIPGSQGALDEEFDGVLKDLFTEMRAAPTREELSQVYNRYKKLFDGCAALCIKSLSVPEETMQTANTILTNAIKDLSKKPSK